MFSMRLCVVMAAAIIGFAAAQTCTVGTTAYSNTTLCTSVLTSGAQQTLCTCTSSTWNTTNSSYPFCTWSNSTNGNCTGVTKCLGTYSAAINTFASGSSITGTCLNDFFALRTCLSNLQSSVSALWNASNAYTACTTYATTVFTGTSGSACATSANFATACPSPLSYTLYFTFGGNWSVILKSSSRRARARANSAAYTAVVAAIDADLAKDTGYTPTSVTLQLTTNGNCLATITLPFSTAAGTSFVAVYGSGASVSSLFPNLNYWFTASGGIGTLTFLGAGTSPVAVTPTPSTASPTSTTPAPSSASVATVAHVLLAVLALVLLA